MIKYGSREPTFRRFTNLNALTILLIKNTIYYQQFCVVFRLIKQYEDKKIRTFKLNCDHHLNNSIWLTHTQLY